MSELLHHIHERPGFKIGKPDGLSMCSAEQKSTIDADFFNQVQLLYVENYHIGQEVHAEDMELEGIDMNM